MSNDASTTNSSLPTAEEYEADLPQIIGRILFEVDGHEFEADLISADDFERDYYDDAIGAGAAFTAPDGSGLVILSPRRLS